VYKRQAYEGDRIELSDGRFVWTRFTDERLVDEQGNVIDPFPEYPKLGKYELREDQLILRTDDGTLLTSRYLMKHAGHHYLLTSEQRDVFHDGDTMPECALHLIDEKSQ
jgi:hypothetical protein